MENPFTVLRKIWFAYKTYRICKAADTLHRATNVQQYVCLLDGKFIIINKKQFKYYKQHGRLKIKTIDELKKVAYYCSKKTVAKKQMLTPIIPDGFINK